MLNALEIQARFGLGATSQTLAAEAHALENQPEHWLRSQLGPAAPLATTASKQAVAQFFVNRQQNKRQDQALPKDSRQLPRQLLLSSYLEDTTQRINLQINSRKPFSERQVLFWSNHFTVALGKPPLLAWVNVFEAEAIRPHLGGSFLALLQAVYRQPAMLFYLDNINSFGPNSPLGRRRGRGLNENLAREILELHTLGVNGGYRQADVEALAKILTGWTLKRTAAGLEPTFAFQPLVHEPGDKIFLGQRIAEGGESEFLTALAILARHPATASHLAEKLAKHFITPTPRESLMRRLRQTFLDTDGDLPSLFNALISHPDAFTLPLTNLRNPYEYAIAVWRWLGLTPEPTMALRALAALNFRPFAATAPAGFPDHPEAWAHPDALLKRLEFAYTLADRLPSARIFQQQQALLANFFSSHTQTTLAGAAESREALALLLVSPELQRR